MLSRRLHTHLRLNGSLHSLVIVFAQVTTLIGSAFLPHVLTRDYAYSDSTRVSTWNGRPSPPHGLAWRSPSSSSPKRQHTFDLLFDPYEVLDIRPMHVDADDVGEVDPDPKAPKRADVQSMKPRSKFKSMPPPPYSLIDISPLPAYTP